MAKTTKKKSRGRPRIELDHPLLMTLASAGCSIDEIAAMLRRSGVQLDMRTLKRRLTEPDYRAAWEEGQLIGKASLRSQMVRQSKLMNGAGVNMAIHLSKHWLGMTERSLLELTGRVDSTVEVTTARERVTRKINTLAERIARRVAGLAAASGATAVPGQPVGN